MDPRHLCFDVDMTLCETGARVVHDDGHSLLSHCRPIPSAVRRLNAFLDEGGRVSFVTGRHETVSWATRKQLRAWLGDRAVAGVDVVHRDFEPYEAMRCVVFKLDALRRLRPDIYVGDLPMDQTAAAAAGVPFLPAEWWSKGHSFDHLILPSFQPRSLRHLAGELGYHQASLPPKDVMHA